jgi:hypothetical protein
VALQQNVSCIAAVAVNASAIHAVNAFGAPLLDAGAGQRADLSTMLADDGAVFRHLLCLATQVRT